MQLDLGLGDSQEMRRDAVLSDDGRCRYRLTRWWGPEDAPHALWVMLNPSTADASVDDPTIRRCIAFTKREGLAGLAVVNVCALRAREPGDMIAMLREGHYEEYRDRNLREIRAAVSEVREREGSIVICAWGVLPSMGLLKAEREEVEPRLLPVRGRIYRFRKQGDNGDAGRPLYLSASTPLVPFLEGE